MGEAMGEALQATSEDMSEAMSEGTGEVVSEVMREVVLLFAPNISSDSADVYLVPITLENHLVTMTCSYR